MKGARAFPALDPSHLAIAVVSCAVFGSLFAASFTGVGTTARAVVPPVPPPPLQVTAAQRAVIEATRGDQATLHSEGETARVANKALPFSRAPVRTAAPFVLGATPEAINSNALTCLTQAIYYEAGFEPESGKRAVAQVVLNRVRHPAFAHSICGVVFQGASAPGCQFSFACDGSLARAPAAGAWQKAKAVALWALAGGTDPDIGMATHYHTDWISPYWAPKLTKITQVGAHIFYRWPGGMGEPRAFASHYSGTEQLWARSPLPGISPSLVSIDPEAAILDRRAPDDVGGRLDVTKGWTLSIPEPSRSGDALARIQASQSLTVSAAVEKPGAGS